MAVYLVNSIEYVETMLAAYKLRAVPINVNYRYVEDELRYILDDSDAKAIVFDREFGSRLAAVHVGLPLLTTLVMVDDGTDTAVPAGLDASEYEAALEAASPMRDFGPRSADDQYIVYTGGTTGNPRA